MTEVYYWLGVVAFWTCVIVATIWTLDWCRLRINHWWYKSSLNEMRIALMWWYKFDYKKQPIPFPTQRLEHVVYELTEGRFQDHVCKKYVLNLFQQELKKRYENPALYDYGDEENYESDQEDQEFDS